MSDPATQSFYLQRLYLDKDGQLSNDVMGAAEFEHGSVPYAQGAMAKLILAGQAVEKHLMIREPQGFVGNMNKTNAIFSDHHRVIAYGDPRIVQPMMDMMTIRPIGEYMYLHDENRTIGWLSVIPWSSPRKPVMFIRERDDWKDLIENYLEAALDWVRANPEKINAE